MSDQRTIHTEYAFRLFRLGMPLVKLHGTNDGGGCRCWAGQRCTNQGKHPAGRSVLASLVQSEVELQKHVTEGGNLGLVLYYPSLKEVPVNPLRLYAFDDDDGTGIAWLAAHGIASPWIVKGRKGYHIWAILPDETPDLFTKNNVFKSARALEELAGVEFTLPKMDLRITGLMVIPMENGKHLIIDGKAVTLETISLLDHFNSLEGLLTWLPRIDPRTVIPGMRVREPIAMEVVAAVGVSEQAEKLAVPAYPQKPVRTKKEKKGLSELHLSETHPLADAFHPNYASFPYHERKRLARCHAKALKPSIPGQGPWGRLLKVVNDSILHYGMSDKTTWEIVRDCFNPRCRHTNGRPYPWRMSKVVETIMQAHEEGSYSTMAKLGKLANPTKVHERLRKKWVKANALRKDRREERKQEMNLLISMAMHEMGFVWMSTDTEDIRIHPYLFNGDVVFTELYNELTHLLARNEELIPNRKVVGGWLRLFGLETYAGCIQRNKTEGVIPLDAA